MALVWKLRTAENDEHYSVTATTTRSPPVMNYFPSLFIVNEQPREDARRQHNKAVPEMNLEAM